MPRYGRVWRRPPQPRRSLHLVFTLVGSANGKTGVPHFGSKYEVE
jgi:hypothetical protein